MLRPLFKLIGYPSTRWHLVLMVLYLVMALWHGGEAYDGA